MSSRELTYLEKIARTIWWRTGQPEMSYPENEQVLWLGYATLALTVGTKVSNENVHDAWTMWSLDDSIRNKKPIHRSSIPYAALSHEVQELDAEYRDAIRAVAADLAQAPIDWVFDKALRAKYPQAWKQEQTNDHE